MKYTYILLFISILGITTTHASEEDILCQQSFREPRAILTLPSQSAQDRSQPRKLRNPRNRIVVSPNYKHNPYKYQDRNSFDIQERKRFSKEERRKILKQVERANNELRRKDSRPPFIHKYSYEKWLFKKQQENRASIIYYGYVYYEIIHKDGSSSFSIKIRPIPHWIKYPDFLKFDFETWQKYIQWAESYFKKFGIYPPLYLQNVKLFMKNVIKIPSKKKEQSFVQDRGLQNVLYTLGQSEAPQSAKLLDMIESLSGHDFWIDGGTGKGFVIRDAIQLLSETRHSKELPSITGITYDSHDDSAVFQNSQKHQIWKGQFFEDIPLSDFSGKKAKLITDFHGVFLYSSQPEQVINKYLQLLSKDGAIAIVYKRESYTTIKDNDQEFTFAQWLSSVAPSLQIETGLGIRQDKEKDTPVHYMIIRNPSGQEIILPPLTLSLHLHHGDINSDHVPQRTTHHSHGDGSFWSVSRILRPYKNITTEPSNLK